MTTKTTSNCRIELFGGVRVLQGERLTTKFRLQKAALLLAYLALNPHRAHSRERLIDLFWPEMESDAGRDNLSSTLSCLRRELQAPQLLLADRVSIRLNPECVTIDVAEFDRWLKQARSSALVAERAALLEKAIRLYEGDLLDGCYEDWALTAQAAYQQRYQEALLDLAQDQETQQNWEGAQRVAEQAVLADPLNEEATLVLMRVQARQGRAVSAIETFRRLQQRLREEMDAEAPQELRQLAERLQQDPDALASPRVAQLEAVAVESAPPPVSGPSPAATPNFDPVAVPNNLPHALTSFIGRQREMEEVQRLMAANRLLTLTGMGGCGKTQISVQIGNLLLPQYPDGVWIVELAALSDPALVPATVAQVLNIKEQPGHSMMQTLLASLRDKKLLLILDNCEHLVAACAALTSQLLRSCPYIKVLATSREALLIAGEQTYRVPTLALPDPQQVVAVNDLQRYGAIALFVERARLVKADFTITVQQAPALVNVCQRLDGNPLAIELAAARLRSLTVEELNRRLDDRFSLLKGGDRTALPRQQTLRALIDWSYNLLSEAEQTLLARFSVFAGGWTLEAAEQVCIGEDAGDASDILDQLMSLVDKSLVLVDEESGATRYRMLETVRQYARDRLHETGLTEAVRARHRDFFLELAERADVQLAGPDQTVWLHRLETEHDNLRASLEWSLLQMGSAAGLRLCGALVRFWSTRGYLSEGREWCGKVLRMPGSSRRTKERTNVLYGMGLLALNQGDNVAARTYLEESLVIAREIQDELRLAHALRSLGNVAYNQGNSASSQAYLKESLSLYRQLGDRWGIAAALNGLGSAAAESGDYALARTYLEESLEIKRQISNPLGTATTLGNLGLIAYAQTDYGSAQAFYQESLAISKEVGDRRGTSFSLNALGNVAFSQGDYTTAWNYYEESIALFRQIGDRRGIALSLNALGNVLAYQGDYSAAMACQEESLSILREVADRWAIAQSLESFAYLAMQRNRRERAVLLWGAAYALREAIRAPLPPNEREVYERTVAEVRQVLGEASFLAHWSRGHDLPLDEAMEFALERNPLPP